MKQICLPVLILICFMSVLYADVNFQYEFSIDKLDNDDNLERVYLFDYDEDGIDDFAVVYDDEYCWSELYWKKYLALYDYNGMLVDTMYSDWEEGYLVFENNLSQVREIFINTFDDSLYVTLIDYSTGNILDSISIFQSGEQVFGLILQASSEISDNKTYLYIGANKDSSGLGYWYCRSYLFSFYVCDDQLFYVDSVINTGYDFINLGSNKLLSIGLYFKDNNNSSAGSNSFDYYLQRINVNNEISSDLIHSTSGVVVFWSPPVEWIHCPVNYEILTKNSLGDYPHILYYQQYDSEDVDSVFFNAYDLDIPEMVWSKKDSLLDDSKITASTCVTVNDEDHYVMYFYDNNTLEIRDRVNGTIIHHQDSVLAVCDILRKSDGELLFFVEKDDETGYDVYFLDGPIFVSADEPHAQDKVIIENFPNPFRSSTTFSFSSKEPIQNAEIKVYNIKGQLVRELRFNASSLPRFLEISWDGKDINGQKAAPGVYLYQLLINGEHKAERKCLLIE
ncbi:MAG: FlgD immunoglobulin-like domain containing protein [Candidatus Celaenobacter antarcticus]|nr:FlgD immunoglobulin-like domain containing protein [Candidatus Celaenobacter antarcticus]